MTYSLEGHKARIEAELARERRELRDNLACSAISRYESTFGDYLMDSPAPIYADPLKDEEYSKAYTKWQIEARARFAYAQADAMLKVRDE